MPNCPPTRSPKPHGSRNNRWQRDSRVRSHLEHQKKRASDEKDEDEQILPLDLKFAKRLRCSGIDDVITKWRNGERSTWGETGKNAYSYEKGELMFTASASWHSLTIMFEEDGLPLDPDPLTTIDILFEVASFNIVDAKKYLYGYKVLNVDSSQRFVRVAPVIRIEYDAIIFPNEKPLPKGAKQPKYKLLLLRGGIRKWYQRDLRRMIISNKFARMAAQSEEAFSYMAQASLMIADAATLGIRKSASKIASRGMKKLIRQRVRKRFKEALKKLKNLEKPILRASYAFIKTFARYLANDQLLKKHFAANKSMSVPQANSNKASNSITFDEAAIITPLPKIGPEYAKTQAFGQAAGQAASSFAQVFVSELLGEMIDKKLKTDVKLARRAEHIVKGKEITSFIDQPLQDELKKTVFDFVVTKNVTGVIKIISNASMNAKNAQEFTNEMEKEFKKALADYFKDAVKDSLKLFNFKAGD